TRPTTRLSSALGAVGWAHAGSDKTRKITAPSTIGITKRSASFNRNRYITTPPGLLHPIRTHCWPYTVLPFRMKRGLILTQHRTPRSVIAGAGRRRRDPSCGGPHRSASGGARRPSAPRPSGPPRGEARSGAGRERPAAVGRRRAPG